MNINRALEREYKIFGYGWTESEVKIFGFRDPVGQDEDQWNDIIGVAYKGDVRLFRGTCDPGTYWTNSRRRQRKGWEPGCAHMETGHYREAYILGNHRGRQALVQRAGKVTIWRDLNGDFNKDENEPVESGYFAINIHDGQDSDIVGAQSAGCQVIQSVVDYRHFLAFVQKSSGETGQDKFSYSLFDRNWISENLWNMLEGGLRDVA